MNWIILFIAGILTILTLLLDAIQISIWIVLGAMLVITILGINFIKANYYDYDCGYDFSITPLLILISLEMVLISTYMATKYNNIEIENILTHMWICWCIATFLLAISNCKRICTFNRGIIFILAISTYIFFVIPDINQLSHLLS